MKKVLMEEGLNKQVRNVWIGRGGGSSVVAISLRDIINYR